MSASESKDPIVQNVVATASLGRSDLDLKEIAKKSTNTEYRPRRFSAVISRFANKEEKKNSTVLIFKTGKIVCTGAKTEQSARDAARRCAKMVSSALGGTTKCSLKEFFVQNIVANGYAGHRISLEKLHHSEHQQFTRYNPEVFPGLIYEVGSPKMALMIFNSGKITFTGAKSLEDLKTAWNNIQPILAQFRA